MTKLPFVGYVERTTELLALVRTNVCGPFDVQIRDGYHYFIIFTNNYSWYGYVYLMRGKSKIFKKFKEFRWKVEKQIEKPLKILRSDQGGEYRSKKF